MPTKELISAIFERTVSDIKLLSENEIGYYFYDEPRARSPFWEIPYHRINIYELAHECKEYLKEYGYVLVIYHHIDTVAISLIDKHAIYNSPSMSIFTEPEAIFKAFEWILKNNEKRVTNG